MNNYLTEDGLYDILVCWVGVENVIRQFKVKLGKITLKIDFKVKHPIMGDLYIEFDSFYHYTNPNQIFNDNIKNELYNIIRIPYFVQLTKETWNYYFGIYNDKLVESTFPHGFISKNLSLPASYCRMGIDRFYDELSKLDNHLPHISLEIRKSIFNYKTKFPKNVFEISYNECIFYPDVSYEDIMYFINERSFDHPPMLYFSKSLNVGDVVEVEYLSKNDLLIFVPEDYKDDMLYTLAQNFKEHYLNSEDYFKKLEFDSEFDSECALRILNKLI